MPPKLDKILVIWYLFISFNPTIMLLWIIIAFLYINGVVLAQALIYRDSGKLPYKGNALFMSIIWPITVPIGTVIGMYHASQPLIHRVRTTLFKKWTLYIWVYFSISWGGFLLMFSEENDVPVYSVGTISVMVVCPILTIVGLTYFLIVEIIDRTHWHSNLSI